MKAEEEEERPGCHLAARYATYPVGAVTGLRPYCMLDVCGGPLFSERTFTGYTTLYKKARPYVVFSQRPNRKLEAAWMNRRIN